MKNFKGVYASLAAGSLALFAASSAMAVDPITTALNAVDLSAVAAAVAVISLLVIAVALTFKGPDIAKRVIRKV